MAHSQTVAPLTHRSSDPIDDKASLDHHDGKDLERAGPTIQSNYDGKASAVERKLLWKLDLRLIPVLGFMYGCSLIDRTDLPNARLSGMDAALGTGIGDRYSIVNLCFFISYVLCEIPANMVLKSHLLTPRQWLPTVTLLFATMKIAFAYAPTWQALAGFRFLLGAFEGALFPGCVFLISSWYPRYETQRRISAFYLFGQLLGGFGSSISYGWSQIPSGSLQGWQLIFIMMGALTFASALLGYVFVIDFPTRATHLSPEEINIVHARITADRADDIEEKMTMKAAIYHLTNWRMWLVGLLFCCTTIPSYAFAYFLSLILKGLGYSTKDSQLLSTPPYICAITFGMIVAFAADRVRMRGPFIILGAIVSLIGTVIIGYAGGNQAKYAGSFLAVMGAQSNIPTVISWGANNVRGPNARAVSSAIIVGMGGVGGIVASVAFRTIDAPQYIPGLLTTITAQAVIVLVVLFKMYYFKRANAAADRGERVLEGHPGFRYTL